MHKDTQYVGELFRSSGISFTFPNLKNLSSSKITYPQFLACVAQRLLLKQHTAHVLDSRNLLCPMSRTAEIFNDNKESFNLGLNNLFLKSITLGIINSQSSKNKVTADKQSSAAEQFVKWYSSYWFDRLKSEEMLKGIESIFIDAEIPSVKQGLDDWRILRTLYDNVKGDKFFDVIGMESVAFINNAKSIGTKNFDDVLEASYKFMEMSGSVDIPEFEWLASKGDLILPTTSAFMLSTITGINEIEDKKKNYVPPLDSYNMFQIFNNTSMSNLLKMNQMLFTTYNYMKILL